MLDKDKYSGEQIAEHYAQLVEKWGEWEIVGEGTAGLVIRYVDVGNAMFSGLMITFCVLTTISFVLSIILGKIVFPVLAKHYQNDNDEMVDLATLKSASQINDMAKTKRGEWF